MTLKSRLIWFGVGLVVLLGVAAVVIYFLMPKGDANLQIQFQKPATILEGSPFTITVSFTNTTNEVLSNTALQILLPDGVSPVSGGPGQQDATVVLGNVAAGSHETQSFDLIAVGDADSVQHITANVSYSAGPNSNNQFQNSSNADLAIGDPAVAFTISLPQKVFSGHTFDMTVNYANNGPLTVSGTAISLQLPSGFNFLGSSMPSSEAGNDTWEIGALEPGARGTLTVTGNVSGGANALYAFNGTLVADFSGEDYTINSQTGNLAVASEALDLSIEVNNTPSYVAMPGSELGYTLNYMNNSDVVLQNVIVNATVAGEMFNLSRISSAASFNSITDTLTWNGATTPGLIAIPPHSGGSVTFTVQTKSAYPTGTVDAKDYLLDVHATIESPTIPPGTTASSTVATVAIENKMGGVISIAAKGYYRSGTYPPKVNQPVRYMIHWIINDYASDAKNVMVSAYLQSGSTLVGAPTSNMATIPQYNAATGLLSWNIPSVAAEGTGTGNPPEAIFQVTNTPAVNQIGSNVTLLGVTTLTASDAFTGVQEPQQMASPVTSAIPDDTSVPSRGRQVTQ